MHVIESRYVMRMIGKLLLLFVLGMLCVMSMADPLPFAFDEPKPGDSSAAGHDFFALETVDFKELQNKRKGPQKKDRTRTMSLAPAWIEPYTRQKKNLLSEEHLRRAEKYLAAEEWSKAVHEMDVAVLRNPDNVILIGRAALVYAMAKEYRQASVYFRIYLQHFPDQVSYLTGWGGVLLRLDDYGQGHTMLARALELDEDNIPAWFQMQTYRLLTNSDEPVWPGWSTIPLSMLGSVVQWLIHEKNELIDLLGREKYTQLIDIVVGTDSSRNLEDISILLRRAVQFEQEGKQGELLRACIRLLENNVDNVWIKIMLAQACYESGRRKKAEDIIRILQKEYPDFYSVWYNGGFIMLQMGMYAEAELMYKRALSIQEAGDAMFALACAYAGQGKIDDSWTILKELRRADVVSLKRWLDGDKVYLRAVKDHPRFYEVGLESE